MRTATFGLLRKMICLINKKMTTLEWLINWYQEQCDGDWEHSFGISIDTLDNPGWVIKIDISDTNLNGIKLEEKVFKVNDADWYSFESNGEKFEGYGDISKLEILINKFKEFTETSVFKNQS